VSGGGDINVIQAKKKKKGELDQSSAQRRGHVQKSCEIKRKTPIRRKGRVETAREIQHPRVLGPKNFDERVLLFDVNPKKNPERGIEAIQVGTKRDRPSDLESWERGRGDNVFGFSETLGSKKESELHNSIANEGFCFILVRRRRTILACQDGKVKKMETKYLDYNPRRTFGGCVFEINPAEDRLEGPENYQYTIWIWFEVRGPDQGDVPKVEERRGLPLKRKGKQEGAGRKHSVP